jgi:hypothetical protein
MKNRFDQILTENSGALIISGMIFIGCAMTAFAAVRWPDAFYGIMGTFLP